MTEIEYKLFLSKSLLPRCLPSCTPCLYMYIRYRTISNSSTAVILSIWKFDFHPKSFSSSFSFLPVSSFFGRLIYGRNDLKIITREMKRKEASVQGIRNVNKDKEKKNKKRKQFARANTYGTYRIRKEKGRTTERYTYVPKISYIR